MAQTSNYGWKQWEAWERPAMADVNGCVTAIDSQLKASADDLAGQIAEKAEVVTGVYSGNGNSSRTINLGFTPKAVLVVTRDGMVRNAGDLYGGLALADHPLIYANVNGVEITSGGFTVRSVEFSGYKVACNMAGSVYYYLAVK